MMNSLNGVGVSDHAVAQFRARIAGLDNATARLVIRDGIKQAENVRVLPDGHTLRVRPRRPFPFEFRAFCVFDHGRGHHVVATMCGATVALRGSKGKDETGR